MTSASTSTARAGWAIWPRRQRPLRPRRRRAVL